MKAMLLMRSDGSYTEGEQAADYAAWAEYEESLKRDGVFLASGQFDSEAARAIRTELSSTSRDDRTENPPIDAAGTLVGYYMVECTDRDEAARYARRAPLYGFVEVHPISAE
ncbi:YciI family protein [Microbacterium luteum]|uniref:YciI family protein n=1 Tax=Microbacterium TaxID=33882 RepID=UPI0018898A0C|nr:YciI family protein [Microbacterium luteum]